MEYYHGTANINAQNIIKSQRFRSDLQIIDSILWEGNRRKIKIPGSLGYGTYTFVNDPQLALMFAKKENKNPVVLQVFIKTVDDDNLLDLTEADSQKQFQKFAGYLRNSQKAQEIFKAFIKRSKKSNVDSRNIEDDNSPRDVYAGIMTELFIAFLKKKGCRVKYVKKRTETLLPPNGYGYQRLGLPNGTEFTIRYPDNDVAKIQKYSFKEET